MADDGGRGGELVVVFARGHVDLSVEKHGPQPPCGSSLEAKNRI